MDLSHALPSMDKEKVGTFKTIFDGRGMAML